MSIHNFFMNYKLFVKKLSLHVNPCCEPQIGLLGFQSFFKSLRVLHSLINVTAMNIIVVAHRLRNLLYYENCYFFLYLNFETSA